MAMPGISILMYHQVGPLTQPENRSTYCHVRRFEAHMGWLRRLGYHVLSMDEAARALEGAAPIPSRAVVLTFDDGYEDFYEYAFPVLSQYGFPAVVYAVAGRLGGQAEWRRDAAREARLLTAEQIRELCRHGITMGAHGLRHLRLNDLTPEECEAEVAASKKALEALTGTPADHFCYPFGAYDAAALEAVRRAGFRTAVTTARGLARRGDHLLELPRKGISFKDNLLDFILKVHLKNRRKDGRQRAESP